MGTGTEREDGRVAEGSFGVSEAQGPGLRMTMREKREWLGLSDNAPDSDVERVEQELVAFLGEAPLMLQPWARSQAMTARAQIVEDVPEKAPEQATVGAAGAEDDEGDLGLPAGYVDDDVLPGGAAGGAGTAQAARSPRPTVKYSGKRKKSPTTVALILVLALGVVVGVYFMGGQGTSNSQAASQGTPASAQAAPQQAPTPVPLDTQRIEELTAKLEKAPTDTVAMRDMANTYFQSGQFEDAAVWQAKVLELEPKNSDARLALGAAKFNSGDPAAAEEEWRQVLADEPTNAEAHYNLGFMFLSKNPPDVEGAKAEWAKVNELAPGSELAATAQAHLDRLEQMPAAKPTTPAAPPKQGGE